MKADDLINFFDRATAGIRNTLMILTGKAVIKMVDDSGPLQKCQITGLAGETLSNIPRIQNFGFASNPPVDSEAIILSLGGMRENVVIVTADNRIVRFKDLGSGESAVYTDDGTLIHLKKGGLIDVIAATKVLVTSPDVEFTGNVKINGNLHTVGNVLVNGTVQGDQTGNFTVGVGAGYFSGPMGGAPMPMVTNVPIVSTAAITSSAIITGSNVVGGGTDLATVKTKFNLHKHGGSTTVPDQTL